MGELEELVCGECNHVALDIKLHQTAYRVVNPLKEALTRGTQGRKIVDPKA